MRPTEQKRYRPTVTGEGPAHAMLKLLETGKVCMCFHNPDWQGAIGSLDLVASLANPGRGVSQWFVRYQIIFYPLRPGPDQ